MKMKSDEAEGNADALIALLRRPGRWVTNKELCEALGFINARGNKSVVGHWPDLFEWLSSNDTEVLHPGGMSGPTRVFSKRAVVLCGLRARTPNAKEFMRWCADALVAQLEDPAARISMDREEFAQRVSNAVMHLLMEANDEGK